MIKKVLKYPLHTSLENSILSLPEDFDVLKVDVSPNPPYQACLWALVDPDAPKKDYRIWIRGTGHDIDPELLDNSVHIGTWFNGPFVWHAFITEAE